jgi:hypothetical protein
MIEVNKIEGFEDKYDNLTINVKEVEIERFTVLLNSQADKNAGLSNVSEDTHSSQIGSDLEMKGKIHLFLKNQHAVDLGALYIIFDFRTKAINDIDVANVFTKMLEYIFSWTKKYVEQNNIKGNDGSRFIVPDFGYTRDYVKRLFP